MNDKILLMTIRYQPDEIMFRVAEAPDGAFGKYHVEVSFNDGNVYYPLQYADVFDRVVVGRQWLTEEDAEKSIGELAIDNQYWFFNDDKTPFDATASSVIWTGAMTDG
jgi:hypothetical protein